MVPLSELWLPILLSAVFVWIGSALVWVVLPHHKSEFRPVPDEAAARAALQAAGPGLYNLPDTDAPGRPLAFLTVLPRGAAGMGGRMAQAFVYYLVVSVLVAYVVGRALPADAHYLTVFRLAGTTAWLGYGFAYVQESIWFGRPWSSTGKHLLDALFYGLLTAGAFGWLWPRGL